MSRLSLLLFLALPAASWAAPVPHSLEHSFLSAATARQTGTQLGFAVAVDDDILAVGSPYDDTSGEESGIVSIYQASTGNLLHVLKNPAPAAEDHFGWSVGVSGNRIVVGAPQDDTLANDTGIAYVYDLSSPTPTVPVRTLENPAHAVNEVFGWSLAISGNCVVVGAPEGLVGTAPLGFACVYDLTSNAAPLRLDNPNASSGANFGWSVAISGQRLMVGAPQDTGSGDASRAYAYNLSLPNPATSVLSLADTTPGTNEQFGYSVSIAGTLAAVAAPWEDTGADNAGAVSVYQLGSATPAVATLTLQNPAPALGDTFGSSVAVAGTRVAIGNDLDDQGGTDTGRVYVFDTSSGTPLVPTVTINNPTPQSNDFFGHSVALSGTRLATGAHGDNTGVSDAGSAYTYELSSGTPASPAHSINTPSPSSEEEFGTAVAISGSLVAIGAFHDDKGTATNAGSAFVYDIQSGNPAQPVLSLDNPAPATNDYFGAAVAVAGDTIVVAAYQDDNGATNAGAVYVYKRSSPTPSQPVLTIPNPSPQAQDQFGNAIALSGSLLVVGAAKNDVGAVADAGSAYVFNLASATPAVPVAVLDNPAPGVDDQFGYAVAISGTRIAVGSPLNDLNPATDAGSAYVYDIGSGLAPVAILDSPAPAADDAFGTAVAISGTRVIIGCPFADSAETDSGCAYAYDLASVTPTVPVFIFNDPEIEPEDFFGTSVAISGTRVLVGSPESDSTADDAGSVYIYELSAADPDSPVEHLDAPAQREGDHFGKAVAIDGTNVLAGAPLHDGTTFNRGAAYLFDPDPPMPGIQLEQPQGQPLGEVTSIHFGDAPVGTTPNSLQISIRNVGTAPLQLTGLQLVAGNTADFEVDTPSLPVTVAVDQAVTFQASFAPAAPGSRLVSLQILSNAGHQNPLLVSLTGQGLSPDTDSDGDGLTDAQELQLAPLGFDWQVNDEELVAILQAGINSTGLYMPSQLQAMHPGMPLLPVDPANQQVTLTIAVKKSTDLQNFSILAPPTPGAVHINASGKLEFDFTSSGPTAFYLLEPR